MNLNANFRHQTFDAIARVEALIKDHKAIDLASGDTGFYCSDELIDLVGKYLREKENVCAPLEGELDLRKQLAARMLKLYDRKYKPETEVLVTAGAVQAVYATIAALVNEGDEVIVIEPANAYYIPAIEMSGGQVVTVQMKGPEYHVNWESVQRMMSAKTRMLILNNPHVPTGWVMTELDMVRLQRIINGTRIIVLSEETFEHMVFDGGMHQSMACLPKMAERSVIISSLGESYHVTGWQIGSCIAPVQLLKEIRKVHQLMLRSVNAPMQMALADFLKEDDEFRHLSRFYQQKRDLFSQLMVDSKFTLLPNHGAFYQLLDYSRISEDKDADFVEYLIKEVGVGTLPLSAFMHDRHNRTHLRINLARPDELLEEAARRLKQI